MSAVINNDYQTNLLFKRFTGVAATQLDQQFSNEPFRSITNIFSRDIMIEEVPSEAPISIFTLDNSSNWTDSIGDAPSIGPSSQKFSDIYPDSHIEFYKNVELSVVPGSNNRVWRKTDGSGNNILQDTLNFKFDDVNSTYLMRVKYNNGSTYINNAINSFPLFWVLDNQSGYLQLYQTTANLATQANIPTNPPKMSFFKYIGKKGLLNLDISGQQQVVDISGLGTDISNVDIILNRLNRMILPNGYVDVSGTDYDLCGNEAVRTYYTYNRKNMFIGYENMPILDSSAVDHSQDPSHNNIIYELDVSGSLYVSNHTQLQDVSCNNLDVSGDLLVLGHTQLQDVSCNNLDVSGDLLVLGHTQLQDVSCNNLDVSGDLLVLGHTQLQDVSCNNLDVSGDLLVLGHTQLQDVSCNNLDVSGDLLVLGHTQLQDVSCNNLDVSGDLLVLGHTQLQDVSCNNLEVSGNITLWQDMSMNGGQITYIGNATDPSGVPSWGQVETAISDLSGSITSSYWTQNGTKIYYNTGNVGIGNTNPSHALEVSGNTLIDGILDMCCNNIIDVSNIYLCNKTALLGKSDGILTISGDLDMSMNQIITIADATDNSGVPSWGQVQTLVSGGGGSFWTQNGTDLYYNTGTVGINIATPNNIYKLDVNGSVNIEQDANIVNNAFISISPTQSVITKDEHLYTRNTNLIDTLKISFETFYNNIWSPMIIANENGVYTSPSTGITQTLSTPNPGKPLAVPTFSSAWGPCVIPIAYLDINQNYIPTPFAPSGGQQFQTAFRPDIANTTAYFTIKFSEPYDAPPSSFPPIDWKTATLYKQYGGSMKSGVGAITEQTITFMVGYIDSYQLSTPSGASPDLRNPKPFIKIISTNIGNLKCLTGITVMPGTTTPANINDLTQNMKYYGFDIETPKIGGICRIIIAESCPGDPANKEIQNKAWLLLEQQWNVEPWQIQQGINNFPIIEGLVNNHIINVRMYSNNLGDLNASRNPPNINEYNTDWQLVTEKQIQANGIYSWEKFVLPMGPNAVPPVFNIPTSPPVTDIPYTLMVGGTPCPNPITGIIDFAYPTIVDGANLWEVWLNLKNWAYGITTTEEVFENNVDICGSVIIGGSTDAQAITATDITCNNIDVNNSIDVGPSQELTIIENKITSTNTATGWAPNFPNIPGTFDPGLELEAENFYFDCGNGVTRGFIISLGDNTSNTIFRIVDNNNNFNAAAGTPPLFQIEGSGYGQTQTLAPWIDMCYNLGASSGAFNRRYKNLYVGNIDASGDINVSGSYGDISATNIDVANDINVSGSYGDISATNIDVSNDLNVEGLINGVGNTTFVEYRNFSADISAVTFDGGASNGPSWHCIATCEGSQDNARGLFIIDDDTSGIREQIIFYAGTSYARGNYINVIAHNWYLNNGPLTTDMKIDVSGNQPTPGSPAIYAGANLYIYRAKSFSIPDVHVRLYQNGRAVNSGGRWVLNPIPIIDLSTTAVELDITYDPNDKRANAISSLDTVFYGDVSFNGDVNINNFNLVGQLETTSDSPISITPGAPPYVWGTNYIQQIDPTDPYLLGSYKQIRSALFIWSGDEGISYGPPNNVPTGSPSGVPVLTPPCQGGGELLKLETPQIWDLPSANYDATNHTFSIPNLASRTMMTVELSIDIWYDSTGADRVNTIFFWLGKNAGPNPAVDGGGTGPAAYRMATHMPCYFGTNSNEPTFCHTASITLLGSEGNPVGPGALINDFDAGDTFYLTAQCVGSPSFPRYKNLRVKVKWEAVN